MSSPPSPLSQQRVDEVAPETRLWLRHRSGVARRWVIAAVAAGIAEGVAGIGQAAAVAAVVHRGFISGHSPGQMSGLLAGLVAAIVARALLVRLREGLGGRAGAALRRGVRAELTSRVLAAGPRRLGGRRPGELVTAALEQVEALDDYAARFLPQRWLAAALPLIIIAVALPVSWAGAAILLLTAPVIPFFAWLIGLGAARASQRQFQALGRLGALFLDRLRGLPTLRLFDRVRAETETVRRSAEAYRRRTMTVLRIAFLSAAVLELFSALGLAMMAVYLGFTLLGQWDFGFWGRELSFGSALFLLILAADFYLPLRALGALHHARAAALGAADSLRQLFDQLESDEAPGTDAAPVDAGVVFDRVRVAPGGRAPVLDELSFEVAPAERVAIVGRSGAGKTTALDLISGLLRPDGGRVLVGGVDLIEVDLEAWRARIGWVGQQPTLFHGTIRSNIELGDQDAAAAEVVAAAQAARVTSFADELPDGLDTAVGEGGVGLSGGQIQRVALARAYLSGAPLLLLDEPTANLDLDSERLVLEALDELGRGRTVIVVTHRLAPCRLADRVLVLEDGRIVEDGPPAAVLGPAIEAAAGPPAPVAPAAVRTTLSAGSAGPGRRRAPMRLLLSLLWPELRWMALGTLLGLITLASVVGLMAVSGDLLALTAVLGVTAAGAWSPAINHLNAGIRAFALLRTLGRYGERLVTHEATFRILARLRVWFFERLAPLVPGRLGQLRSGDLFERVVGDIDALTAFYVRALSPFVVAQALAALATVFLLAFDPVIALVTLVLLVVGAVALPAAAYLLAGGLVGDEGERARRLRIRWLDTFTGLTELTLFGALERQRAALEADEAALLTVQHRGRRLEGTLLAAGRLLGGVALAAALWLGVEAVVAGSLIPRHLTVVALTVMVVFELISPLPLAFLELRRSRSVAVHLGEILEEPPAAAAPRQPAPAPEQTTIRLEAVTFAYGPGVAALTDVSATIEPGTRVALLGPTGSGKSTLAALLVRFWDPAAGRISIGGTDLRELAEEDLRRLVAMVPQRPHLFSDSVRKNLLHGRPGASDEELRAALEAAELAELGGELDSLVGEGGRRLSGGQARRLAMARALLCQAPVLVLDEPTEDLDRHTGARLLDRLLTAATGRSLILITHDLNGLDRFDRIVVLDRGRVLEQGTHDELLRTGGRYASLMAQLSSVERLDG